MAIKRDKVDAVFSQYIRARDKYTCQRCGRVYFSNSFGLHCSHHYSRRHRSIRWDELNACALCYPCHEWFGSNPLESAEWLKEYLGPEKLEELRKRKEQIKRWTKAEKEEHYKILKKKLSDML